MDGDPRQTEITPVIIEPGQGDRQPQILDVGHSRFPEVQRVDDIHDTDIIRCPPDHDLTSHLHVQLLAKASPQVGFTQFHLTLIIVQHRVGILAAAIDPVGKIVIRGSTDKCPPAVCRLDAKLEQQLRFQAGKTAPVSLIGVR